MLLLAAAAAACCCCLLLLLMLLLLLLLLLLLPACLLTCVLVILAGRASHDTDTGNQQGEHVLRSGEERGRRNSMPTAERGESSRCFGMLG